MIKRTPKYLAITIVSLVALAGADGVVHAESATYQAEVGQSINITMPTNLISVFVDPSNRPFDSADFSISVSTNNTTGYYMTMSSEITDLVKITDTTKTLPTLSANEGGYTEETFEANKWGYKIGSANYIPFVSGAKIAEADTIANNDITNLTFATKVDYLQSSGIYQGILDFFAVANPTIMAIQNLDAAYCTNDPLVVMDARDGEEYTIQKLADGNCWMLDNLRLDPTETSLAVLKGRTNATDKSLTYLKEGGGTGQYAAEAVISDWQDADFYHAYYTPRVVTTYKDTVPSETHGIGSNKYGVYYNYCAASAGSYCWEAYTNESQASNEDICPSGWRLPSGRPSSGTTDNDYEKIVAAYSTGGYQDYNAITDALSVPLAGWFIYHDASEPRNIGENARFWTSTYMYARFWRYWTFNISQGSGTYLNDGNEPRSEGYTVRCMMKPTIASATYIQDVTKEMINNTAIGATATVKDKRDNEVYKIAKLADGNVWMLDNLRLDLIEVPLENLEGNTNATDEALGYLKNGGGTAPYANVAVAPFNGYGGHVQPKIEATAKDQIAPLTIGAGSGKVGVYYNFCAATAGTYCSDPPDPIPDITQDVCPSGWRIPTGGTSEDSEFNNLYLAYNSNVQAFVTAFSLPLSGNTRLDTGPMLSNDKGAWWSSTKCDNDFYPHDLKIYGNTYNAANTYTGVNNGGSTDHYWGETVRCIAKTE